MKRYIVWARCGRCNNGEDHALEFENTVPDNVIEAECADTCDTLVANSFDTGWNEETEHATPDEES